MRKAAEWSERVSAWKASGQADGGGVRAQPGLSPRTLVWWASRLRHSATTSGTAQVPMARVVRATADVSVGSSAIVIEIGSARVLVHGEPSASALHSVLAVLRAEGAR
jgi:hypothetical protein